MEMGQIGENVEYFLSIAAFGDNNRHHSRLEVILTLPFRPPTRQDPSMKGLKLIKFVSATAAVLSGFAIAAPAQTPGMLLLNGLSSGEWTLRERGANEPGQKICLGNPELLLQIQHGGSACTRYVIENSPNKLRVSYKCGRSGQGVTEIKKESSSLIQISTQGIRNNAPFSLQMEGRRTGSC
ncbi:DUF3617 domain-containing protein [Parasphingorhabdus sp.]|uniref:DUF3617 domain-containing protein n=1 Tax=Parasphingorhabdus sp. TaxID=2709688 RepID=UPI0030013E3A